MCFVYFGGNFKQYMEYLEPWILSDVLVGETGQPSSLGALGRKGQIEAERDQGRWCILQSYLFAYLLETGSLVAQAGLQLVGVAES